MTSYLTRRFIMCACILTALSACQQQSGQSTIDKPGTDDQKLSYSLGVMFGNSINRDMEKNKDINLDQTYFAKGISDILLGKEPDMSKEEVNATMQAYTAKMQTMAAEQQEKRMQTMQDQGEENKKEGEAFLADNKKKEGVKELESGLQYKVISASSGKKPTSENRVKVHYRGRFIDGEEFDSSYERGEPASFQVGQVIPGWQQALQLMPTGSKWEIYVPAKLAYGAGGAGDRIGPNKTLIFEVELLEIES